MKPGPANPWATLRWRFVGCLVLLPALLFGGWVLPENVALVLLNLPILLWLAALALFARARFWRHPRPLWGRWPLRDGRTGLALRLAATLATLILGPAAFVLALLLLVLPFNAGRW